MDIGILWWKESSVYFEMFELSRSYTYPAYYKMLQHTKSRTKAVLIYLFSTCEFNAFSYFQRLNPGTKVTYKEFIEVGSNHWTGYFDPTPKYEPSSSSIVDLGVDTAAHQQAKMLSKNKKKLIRRICQVCSTKEKPVLTNYMCKKCRIPLHRHPCYMKYHSFLKKYYSLKCKYCKKQ